MQKTKIITIDEGITVTVREFKVKDVKALLARSQDLQGLPIMELFTTKFDEMAAFLKPYIETDTPLDEFSFSELEQIKDGLLEVNGSFFKMGDQVAAYLGRALQRFIEPALVKLLGEMPAGLPTNPSPTDTGPTGTTSTSPASASSNGAT